MTMNLPRIFLVCIIDVLLCIIDFLHLSFQNFARLKILQKKLRLSKFYFSNFSPFYNYPCPISWILHLLKKIFKIYFIHVKPL